MVTPTSRWNKAQIAEKKFWIQNQKFWSVQNPNQYWLGILKHGFNLDYKFFAGKAVLEVGCGPTGIIYEFDNTKLRVGLEPMDLQDLVKDADKKLIVRKGMGEEMPFEDNFFDIVISFDALDHSANPTKVAQEIYRVLRREGEFFLWNYALRKQYQVLKGLLNRIDRPHPHHFTRDELVAGVLGDNFEVKYCKNENGTGLPNNTIKKAPANQMMDTVWMRSTIKKIR
jgi:SAM-dependent methyltransferase